MGREAVWKSPNRITKSGLVWTSQQMNIPGVSVVSRLAPPTMGLRFMRSKSGFHRAPPDCECFSTYVATTIVF